MAKFRNFKRKGGWKRIVSAILVSVLVASLGGALISFAVRDSKTISLSSFSVGGLNENGEYIADDKSIYTKDAFECIGLRVQPDFESQVTYDVYYYDYDERLVHVEKGLSSVYDEDFPLAQYCRIVIHPEIPEGTSASDFKIKWYQVRGYADDVKITVDRKQEYLYGNCVNLYNDDNAVRGKGFGGAVGAKIEFIDNVNSAKCSEEISIDANCKFVDVYVRNREMAAMSSSTVVITSDDGIVIASNSVNTSDYNAGEWVKYSLEIPDGYDDVSLYTKMYETLECYIFAY